MKSYNVRKSPCPACSYIPDRASLAPNEPTGQPKPGDVTICINCGALLVFDDQMNLANPSPEQLVGFKADHKRWDIITFTQVFIRAERLKHVLRN